MSIERWKQSKMYPRYEVNNYGTVRDINTKKTIYPTTPGRSDLFVRLKDENGVSDYRKLSEVVADAFCKEGLDHTNMKAIHKNNNRYDNAPGNLMYVPIKKKDNKRKRVSYSNTKLRCFENGEEYYNLYEVEFDLGIPLRRIAECVRDGSLVLEVPDGYVYHFELIE